MDQAPNLLHCVKPAESRSEPFYLNLQKAKELILKNQNLFTHVVIFRFSIQVKYIN